MTDFKALYDRVLNAQAEVQVILNSIDAAMAKGTEEGATEALELEPKLDEAITRRDEAQAFYDKVKNAHTTNQVAVDFVPVSATPNEPDGEEEEPNVKTRDEFQNLHPAARVDFLKAGGKVVDQ